jgi:P4 family phage/plasmid primase-like protien
MNGLEALADVRLWLRWKRQPKPGKPGDTTKVPYSTHGPGQGSHTRPADWGTLAEARSALARWGGDGLGAVATTIDEQFAHACLDVDGCFPADSDERAGWVDPVAEILDGHYCEVSVSGTGLHYHFLIRRDVAAKRRWRINAKRESGKGQKDHGFELAVSESGGYYLTTTLKGTGELRLLDEPQLEILYDFIAAFRPKPVRKSNGGAPKPDDPDLHTRTLDAIAALDNDGRFAARDSNAPHDWISVLAAVHDGTRGSPAGLRACIAWTERAGHQDAEDSCARAWTTFALGGGITVATLFMLLDEQRPRRPEKLPPTQEGPPPSPPPPPVQLPPPEPEPHPRPQDEALQQSEQFVEAEIINTFTAAYGNDWRYVALWGTWLRWSGRHWQVEETQLVIDLITDICATFAQQRHRLTGSRVRVIENLCQARRAVARASDAWDSDPMVLNTTAGTYDLATGQMREWCRDDHLTKLAGAAPRGDCPKFKAFLDRATGGNLELQAYLQRVAGYYLTGNTGEHVFFFAHGGGRNGKSTFFNVLSGILGDYARNMPAETFTESKYERHPTELAAMRGYRLITATEVRRISRWNETRMAELTGGEEISARFMRENFFKYRPQFKLLIGGNHKPGLRSVTEAMRARLHLLPFTVTIPKAERVKDYWKVLLDEEGDGIMAWAVEGCRDWQRQGLDPPEVVKAATERYFADQDTVGRWLAECCIERRNAVTGAKALYKDWKSWCEANGENAGSQKLFSQALEERGFSGPHHTRNGSVFKGLALASEAQMEADL